MYWNDLKKALIRAILADIRTAEVDERLNVSLIYLHALIIIFTWPFMFATGRELLAVSKAKLVVIFVWCFLSTSDTTYIQAY